MKWKPIKDFEDRYLVSDTGLIKAVERKILNKLTGRINIKPEIILKPNTVAFGYQQVTLYKENVRSSKYVHVLVMQAFVGEKTKGYEINHKDEDKLGEAKLLAGVSKFPQRIKCATLSWNALKKAIERSEL